MAKTVVIINGPGRSGKDTFIEYCKEISTPQVYNFSSIDQIVEVSKTLGWDGEKTEAVRKFWHDLKIASSEFNNGPTKYLISRVQAVEPGSLVFLHIREPEEIQKFQTALQESGEECRLIKIHFERDNAFVGENGADNRTREVDYDYYFENNGSLEELRSKALNFLQTIDFEIRENTEKTTK